MEVLGHNDIELNSKKIDTERLQKIETLTRHMKNKSIIKVYVDKVRQIDNGKNKTTAWEVYFDDIGGVIPFEQSGLPFESQMGQYGGQEIFVRVVKVKRNPDYVIASRSLVIEEMEERLLNKLRVGREIKGIVRGIGNNNVYVDIGGGVTVKMDRKEASLSTARKSLKRYFHLGQVIDVKVTNTDKEAKKISVSHVATMKSPWTTANYKRGDIVVGEIVNFDRNKKIIFVEVDHGLDGIMSIPDAPIDLEVGDRVQVKITKFEPENRKFRLLLKNKLSS